MSQRKKLTQTWHPEHVGPEPAVVHDEASTASTIPPTSPVGAAVISPSRATVQFSTRITLDEDAGLTDLSRQTERKKIDLLHEALADLFRKYKKES
jgi:hypothetical protein